MTIDPQRVAKRFVASKRSELAERFADLIRKLRLTTPYGGDVGQEGRYYSITFAKPRTVDGVVKVYSPRFIQMSYQTGFRDLPPKDSRVFTSEKNAKDFLKAAFIDLDFDKALSIPTR